MTTTTTLAERANDDVFVYISIIYRTDLIFAFIYCSPLWPYERPHNLLMRIIFSFILADESDSGIGLCGWLLTAISWGLVMVTLPFSLFVCFKVVQEYERAVIFRLGRLLSGGSRGPGTKKDLFLIACLP